MSPRSMTTPTRRTPGQAFALGIRVEDRWGNPSPAGAAIQLSSNVPVQGLPQTLTLDSWWQQGWAQPCPAPPKKGFAGSALCIISAAITEE